MAIYTSIERLENIISEVLMNEWEAQGHSMGGNVVKTIKYVVKQTANEMTIEGYMYPYGSINAAGVKANKIPFSGTKPRGQGGGTSLYIQALQKYVQARMGINDDKKSLGIAFAIAKTQKREGMPTKGSYAYSSTGKRTEWIGEALSKNEEKILESIREMCYELLSVNFDVIIDKWQMQFNTV